MSVESIVNVIIIVATFVITTAIPFIIGLVDANKKRKAAKKAAEEATTEAELAKAEAAHQAAINDMLRQANVFVEQMEGLYKNIDGIVKEQGSTTGPLKKEGAMTKLQAYAIENGYEFDAEYWSKYIDDTVKLTHNVNSQKKEADTK